MNATQIVIEENHKGQWKIGGVGRWRNQLKALSELQAARADLRAKALPFLLQRADGTSENCMAFVLGWAPIHEYEKREAMLTRLGRH